MAVHPKKFYANGLPTLIGSMPAESHQQAMEWILDSTPEIPLWPQLPALAQERMLNQFIEGFPGIVEDEDRTYFDLDIDGFEKDQLLFYEEYLKVTENFELQLKDW